MLRDKELVDLIEVVDDVPLVANLKQPADWFGQDSPVQPSSVDLTVGAIHVPGAKEGELGCATRPLNEFSLDPGATVVLMTHEKVSMGPSRGGLAFPPTSMANRGILMTNPGHIDPGYSGPLSVTAINMGRRPFPITSGNKLMTLVVFDLGTNAEEDYEERIPGLAPSKITQERLDNLSYDFLDVTDRSKSIARNTGLRWGLAAPVLTAIVIAAVSIWGAGLASNERVHRTEIELERRADREELEELRRAVVLLQANAGSSAEIDELKARLDALEKKLATND